MDKHPSSTRNQGHRYLAITIFVTLGLAFLYVYMDNGPSSFLTLVPGSYTYYGGGQQRDGNGPLHVKASATRRSIVESSASQAKGQQNPTLVDAQQSPEAKDSASGVASGLPEDDNKQPGYSFGLVPSDSYGKH